MIAKNWKENFTLFCRKKALFVIHEIMLYTIPNKGTEKVREKDLIVQEVFFFEAAFMLKSAICLLTFTTETSSEHGPHVDIHI